MRYQIGIQRPLPPPLHSTVPVIDWGTLLMVRSTSTDSPMCRISSARGLSMNRQKEMCCCGAIGTNDIQFEHNSDTIQFGDFPVQCNQHTMSAQFKCILCNSIRIEQTHMTPIRLQPCNTNTNHTSIPLIVTHLLHCWRTL